MWHRSHKGIRAVPDSKIEQQSTRRVRCSLVEAADRPQAASQTNEMVHENKRPARDPAGIGLADPSRKAASKLSAQLIEIDQLTFIIIHMFRSDWFFLNLQE